MPQTGNIRAWQVYPTTAAVAFSCGTVAWYAGLPVPWMLGALFGTAAFAIGGVRLAVPSALKTAAHACIGLILGAAIDPDTFARAAQWPQSLMVLLVGMILMSVAAALYYIRVAGFDRLTATAASLTGGLSHVVTLAIQLGANPAGTVIGQLLRLTAVVTILPFAYTLWLGAPDDPVQIKDAGTGTGSHLWILLLGWPAFLLARRCRLPVPDMIGPMLVSAACAMLGYTLVLPAWLFATVFVVVGAVIGAQFYGFAPRSLVRIGGHGVVATGILLAGSALVAYPLGLVAGVPFHVALLAVAPGGVAEIAILATILGVDPVFVTFHQVFRNIVLNAAAPFVLSRMRV